MTKAYVESMSDSARDDFNPFFSSALIVSGEKGNQGNFKKLKTTRLYWMLQLETADLAIAAIKLNQKLQD